MHHSRLRAHAIARFAPLAESRRMRPIASVIPLALAAMLAACGGQSKQEKAQSQVCTARADISKQVKTLKGLTLSTATTSQAKSSLQAIRDDLGKIRSAQGDLNAD